jgi:hypothetical protein
MQPVFLSVIRRMFLGLTGPENGRVPVSGGGFIPNKVIQLGEGFLVIFIFGKGLKS